MKQQAPLLWAPGFLWPWFGIWSWPWPWQWVFGWLWPTTFIGYSWRADLGLGCWSRSGTWLVVHLFIRSFVAAICCTAVRSFWGSLSVHRRTASVMVRLCLMWRNMAILFDAWLFHTSPGRFFFLRQKTEMFYLSQCEKIKCLIYQRGKTSFILAISGYENKRKWI